MPQVPQGPGKIHAVRAFFASPWLLSLYAAIAITAATLLLSSVDSGGAGNLQVLQLPGNIQLNNQGLSDAQQGLGDEADCEDLDPNVYSGLPAVYFQSNQVCPGYNQATGFDTNNLPNTYYVDPLGLLVDLVVFTLLARLVFLFFTVVLRRHKKHLENLSVEARKKLEKHRAKLWMTAPAVCAVVAGALLWKLTNLLTTLQPDPVSQPAMSCFSCPAEPATVYSTQYTLTSIAAGLVEIALVILLILVVVGIVIGILKLRRLKKPSALSQNSDTASATQASKGWSWGAFFLTWIWGSVNNVGKAYMVFIPIYGIYWAFVLGAKGNTWAWEQGNWSTVESFKKSQKQWAVWGAVTVVVFAIIAFGLWSYGSSYNSVW